MKKLTLENPLEKGVDIVLLISSKAADFVYELIEEEKEKGADLVVGGKRNGD